MTLKQILLEGKQKTLAQAIEDKSVEKLWNNGGAIIYNGDDLYDLYEAAQKKIRSEIEYTVSADKFEGQEVYLGYDKKEDLFYTGWDAFLTYEDEDGEEDRESAGITVLFELPKGRKVNVMNVEVNSGNTFYKLRGKEGYGAIKANKDIVDIRLD